MEPTNFQAPSPEESKAMVWEMARHAGFGLELNGPSAFYLAVALRAALLAKDQSAPAPWLLAKEVHDAIVGSFADAPALHKILALPIEPPKAKGASKVILANLAKLWGVIAGRRRLATTTVVRPTVDWVGALRDEGDAAWRRN
jgi:hypothetical protein